MMPCVATNGISGFLKLARAVVLRVRSVAMNLPRDTAFCVLAIWAGLAVLKGIATMVIYGASNTTVLREH